MPSDIPFRHCYSCEHTRPLGCIHGNSGWPAAGESCPGFDGAPGAGPTEFDTYADYCKAAGVDGIRMLVCGGRDFDARTKAFDALDAANTKTPIALVIEGGARGADRIAREWAIARGRAYVTFPADWAHQGRAAGALRNARMLEVGRPHGVTAFPGGTGTEDMVKRAKAAGVPVWEALRYG